MASSYRGNGPQSALNTQFRGAALAITGLLKAAQAQSQDAYRQGYNDALQDALEALQNGLAVHQDGDASMGIPALIDWIEARQAANHNDSSDAEETEDPTPAHQKQTQQAEVSTQTHHTSARANSPGAGSPISPPNRLPSCSAVSSPVIPASLPANSDFTFSFPQPSSSNHPSNSNAANSHISKKALRHQRQAMRREGVHYDVDEMMHNAPSSRKRKWWEDSLANGLVSLDLDSASASNQQSRRQQEDQALRLFGEVSAESARPMKRPARR